MEYTGLSSSLCQALYFALRNTPKKRKVWFLPFVGSSWTEICITYVEVRCLIFWQREFHSYSTHKIKPPPETTFPLLQTLQKPRARVATPEGGTRTIYMITTSMFHVETWMNKQITCKSFLKHIPKWHELLFFSQGRFLIELDSFVFGIE